MGPLRAYGVLEPGFAGYDFLEVAPENWIGVGGKRREALQEFTRNQPLLCHGLSLSLGGPAPLDENLLEQVGEFLDEYDVPCYSEHLSFCSDDGHLYDLLPIPFTREAVDYVVARIQRSQELLGRRIAIENVSYYATYGAEMSEIEFINQVLEGADCNLLLDVNNIYVNAVNHRYDARAFLTSLPAERIAYGHIAGHKHRAEDLIVDTHGAAVVDDVWALLDCAYEAHGVFPMLLERDTNFPPLDELFGEVERIRTIQQKHSSVDAQAQRKSA
jgi:uncharacterized protein (UPF0276 family)